MVPKGHYEYVSSARQIFREKIGLYQLFCRNLRIFSVIFKLAQENVITQS